MFTSRRGLQTGTVASGARASGGNVVAGNRTHRGGWMGLQAVGLRFARATLSTPPSANKGAKIMRRTMTSLIVIGAVLAATEAARAADPVTVTFQQGVNGYSGTVDTYIQYNVTSPNAGATTLSADGTPPDTDIRQILLRFDNIFGAGANQIPAGAVITSATLTVNVSNDIAIVTNIHRMLHTWDDDDVWSTFGNGSPWNTTAGVQADGVDAVSTPDAAPATVTPAGLRTIDVTTSLQAWSTNTASNFGWVFLVAGADTLAFDSSEGATHPLLTVKYYPPGTQSITFQNGLNGYAGTHDAHIMEYYLTTNYGSAAVVKWDTDEPNSSGKYSYGLFRFDGVFGSDANQIPSGSTILAATLTLYITNVTATAATMNEVAVDWTEDAVTWNTFGATAGVQAEDYGATVGSVPLGTINTTSDIDVTSSIAYWAATPIANRGWIIRPNTTDGQECASSEATTQTQRPKLTVLYVPPPCTSDLDCDDGLFCNGDETCNTGTGVCEAGTPVSCSSPTPYCDETLETCVECLTSAQCSDGDVCNGTEACVAGVCEDGTPLTCDDEVACTDDSCVPASGCQHVDNCTGGKVCNHTTGNCERAPVTVTFQQGDANGYTGTADTYIDSTLGSQATANPLVVDLDPVVEQALIRFDGIFGSGANQIPAGSTIESATLTMRVGGDTNDYSPNPVGFHRLLHPWDATDVWADYGVAPWNLEAGVQADDDDALEIADATTTMGALNTSYPVDVTGAVQAWSAAPSSNYGWVILMTTGTDGLRVQSSESTTVSYRPLLSVTYTTGCDSDADCDDGNPCTDDTCDVDTGECTNVADDNNPCSDGNDCTDDVCVGGVCVGTNDDLNTCDDGIACTGDDLCNQGVCAGTDGCTPPLICNHATGVCEPPAPLLPIVEGNEWKYFRGQSEPPVNWNTVAFDDSSWETGPSGFGYADGDDNTLLDASNPPAMQNNYLSVYIRRAFYVSDPSSVYGLELSVDYDDAYVCYINGTEVARSSNITGTPPPYNASQSSGHISVDHEAGTPVLTSVAPGVLTAGYNVLACQGHNATIGSSDFSLIPELEEVAAPNAPPDQPTDPSPVDGAINVALSPDLCVDVSDPEAEELTVTFWGREVTGEAGDPFTIVVLPDPQNYAQSYPSTYYAQTQWCVDNRVSRNIVFVAGLGDMTNDASTTQWGVASTAFATLDMAGLPYGMCVGNHDQNPTGSARTGSDEGATTVNYNATFPKSRIQANGYFVDNYTFGGTYPNNMDNYYVLFNAGGMDFIVFFLESEMDSGGTYQGVCTSATCLAVVQWVDALLTNTYPNHRAIIISHALMAPAGAFHGHGQVLYDALKDNPNVFLMNCGHLDQANHRVDPGTDGHPIYTLISDYQMRSNGGNGWLRILTFDPQSDTSHVETFPPTVVTGGRFINKPTAHGDNAPNDACARDCYVEPGGTYAAGGNELMLPYDMEAGEPFVQIGAAQVVASGGTACVSWPGRAMNTQYEWYVTISDGNSTTTSSRWDFTTATTCTTNEDCADDNDCTDDVCDNGTCTNPPNNGNTCTDNNECTDDVCDDGVCQSTPNSLSCADDGNPCTDDVCSGGTCTHPANDANSCTDDNACTTDVCSGGVCQSSYTPQDGCCTTDADCDDGNAGTSDACEELTGNCSNVQNVSCTSDAESDDEDACTTDECVGENVSALNFDGTNDYVTMGVASGLGTAEFTIETWFRRTGTGVGNTTGTSGISSLVPLVAKGAPEADGSNVDANYVLGINTAGDVLAADFEDTATGLNHPVSGTTQITLNTWYHAAASYDGTTWRLYLNGNPEATLVVGAFTPRSDSIQHFGLGAMLTSAGSRLGAFQGILDEVRIWNRALSQAEIQAGMQQAITSGTGLIGRWGLDENPGTTAHDSTAPAEDGTLTNGPTWSPTDKAPLSPGVCSHTPIPNCTPCTSDAECNDSDACTTDACVNNVCQHAAVVCDDGEVCTEDSCNPATGCVHTAINENGACDDDDACTTNDICINGVCTGTLISDCCDADNDCDDGDVCTDDACDTANLAALSFDGSNDYINLGNDGNTAEVNYLTNYGTGSFTIEGWFLANTATTYMGLFRQGSQNAYPQVVVQFPGSSPYNRIAGSIETSTSGTQVDTTVSTQFTLGQWYHYAMVADRTPGAQTLTVYLHDSTGALVDSAQTAANAWGTYPINDTYTGTPPNEVRDPVILGAVRTAPGGSYTYYFNGRLDEVRIWDHARTAQQILDNVNRQLLAAPGLRHRWAMNEGIGTTIADSGSTPTTAGTLVNGPTWRTLAADIPTFGDNTCVRTPIDGCCNTDDDCDDWNACTADTCVDHVCQHPPVGECCVDADCTDSDPCTVDTCNTGTYTCQHAPNPGAACDDGDACTSGETCDGAGNCAGGTPVSCDDGNVCTTEICASLTSESALAFNGSNQYLDFGLAATHPELGLAQFTLELWFQKTGAGVETAFAAVAPNNAVPLVTKGRGIGDGDTRDENYFLGISASNTLAFNFEQKSPAPVGGDNVVQGATNINDGQWHHAAVTYDGQSLKLYVDGAVDGASATLATTSVPRDDSAHPFGIATAFDGWTDPNTPAPAGYFAGNVDEVRVWDHALTASEIAANRIRRIPAAPGLVGRWGLDEGTGLTAADSSGNAYGGTLKNGPTWVAGAPSLGLAVCMYTNEEGPCEDGQYCTTGETCQSGACTGGTATDCSAQNDQCHVGVCNETTDACEAQPANEGQTCDDGLFCTTGETCQGGNCTGGTATCNDDNPCTADSCDEVGNQCVNNPLPNGTACDDGDFCTTGEVCTGGVCEGDPTCDDGNDCTTDVCTGTDSYALKFDGSNDYVTMGAAAGEAALGARAFTLEAWIKKDGASWGTANASTGTGGLQNVVALVTKGRSEADGTTADCNYFFGITAAGRLVADFEQYAASGDGAPAGQNRPICSRATDGVITDQNWHHVAVTYSAAAGWTMFLDGTDVTAADGLPATCGTESTCSNAAYCVADPGVEPRYDSIQHAGLGVALNSTGANPGGYFGGMMDEARVWNYARSAAEIQAGMSMQIRTAPGLIGRWGLNDGTGTTAVDSTTIPTQNNGTLTPTANPPLWVTGAPDLGNVECSYSAGPNGTPCDDGDVCTTGTTCSSGVCGGGTKIPGCCNTAAECDDGNICTDDACTGNQCVHTNNTLTCSDGDPCTANDTCSAGVCAGTPILDCCQSDTQCEDSNVCTDDTCNTANDAAIKLNGTNQYVNLGNDDATTAVNYMTNFGNGSFTIEGWFAFDNTAAPAQYTGIFRQGRQGGNPQVVVQYNTAVNDQPAGLALSVETDTGNQKDIATELSFPTGWHHFAMVVNRTTNQLELWLDGVKKKNIDTTAWGTSAISNKYPTDAVWLGVARDSGGAILAGTYLNGKVDEIRTWDYAWTTTDFESYMGKQVLSAAGLRHRWALDEGTGATTADSGSTPTGPGTLVNSPTWLTDPAAIPDLGPGTCEQLDTTPAGQCCDPTSGTLTPIDDDDPCTTDVCNADGTVTHTGPPAGQCCDPTSGTLTPIDDDDPCTTDVCNADGSVTHVNNTLPCDDGDACTTGDVCTAGACAGTPLDCDDGNPCTADTCVGGVCQHEVTEGWVTLEVEGLGVYSPPVTRTVTFITTDCQTNTVQTIPVAVTFTANPIQVVIPGINTAADWIQATEGHTLSTLVPLTFGSTCVVAELTGANRLRSGDFSNPPWVSQDDLVDIQDFAILAIYWNDPVDPNLDWLADATGDGWQGTGDFTVIQINFAQISDPPSGCGAFAQQQGHIVPEVAVEPLAVRMPVAALGIPDATAADLDGDGWIGPEDVRRFAARHRLVLRPEFQARLARLEALFPIEAQEEPVPNISRE